MGQSVPPKQSLKFPQLLTALLVTLACVALGYYFLQQHSPKASLLELPLAPPKDTPIQEAIRKQNAQELDQNPDSTTDCTVRISDWKKLEIDHFYDTQDSADRIIKNGETVLLESESRANAVVCTDFEYSTRRRTDFSKLPEYSPFFISYFRFIGRVGAYLRCDQGKLSPVRFRDEPFLFHTMVERVETPCPQMAYCTDGKYDYLEGEAIRTAHLPSAHQFCRDQTGDKLFAVQVRQDTVCIPDELKDVRDPYPGKIVRQAPVLILNEVEPLDADSARNQQLPTCAELNSSSKVKL